jgi:hypothetical protein
MASVAVCGVTLFWSVRIAVAASQLYDATSNLRALIGESETQDTPALASELRRADQSITLLQAEAGRLKPFAYSAAGIIANVPGLGATADAVPDLLTVGEQLAAMAPHLSWLLGMDAPRTLLVLAQNNHELRATGGLISAAGTVTIDKGQVQIGDLVDAYALYSEDIPHPRTPAPLQKYMHIDVLQFREANWSPDGPTSAKLAAELYKLNTGREVDGVLLLDTGVLVRLLEVLGEIRLEERNATLTQANLEQQLIAFWNPQIPPSDLAAVAAADPSSRTAEIKAVLPQDWWDQRKSFVPQIAEAVLEGVRADSGDALATVRALTGALEDRSLQLWVKDAPTAAVLHTLAWDGALAPRPDTDFLAVVDSNVGFNKVDAVLARQLEYAVKWPETSDAAAPSLPVATLTLTYTHPITTPDPGCDPTPRYGTDYQDMIERCYFNYVRVYTPAGSRLISTDGLQPDSVTSDSGEKELQVFAGYFVQPPNTVHTVTFAYTLPVTIQPRTYALTLQRQAGVKPLPVTLHVASASTSTELQSGYLEWRPKP